MFFQCINNSRIINEIGSPIKERSPIWDSNPRQLVAISFLTFWEVKMCDKLAISAYILKIVEKDPFLRFQMKAKEMFNRHQFFSTNKQYVKIFFGKDEILVKH